MPRLSALIAVFVLGAASAVALASCGGEDAELLPGTTADQIESNLNEVEQLTASGDCIGAEDAVAEVAAEVEELRSVDLKLKAALQEGATRLREVVGRCEEETTSEEPEPTLETEVEPEEVEEDEEKPKKDKQEKEEVEPAEPKEETSEGGEGPTLPPQSEGQGEEKGKGEPPAEQEPEETPSSGGVGPSVGVE